jgi:hypothetical protein
MYSGCEAEQGWLILMLLCSWSLGRLGRSALRAAPSFSFCRGLFCPFYLDLGLILFSPSSLVLMSSAVLQLLQLKTACDGSCKSCLHT